MCVYVCVCVCVCVCMCARTHVYIMYMCVRMYVRMYKKKTQGIFKVYTIRTYKKTLD